LLFPVRLGVTAPAEIIAEESQIVTVPFDGVIRDINVYPGDDIKAGQVLFTMDGTVLEGSRKLAEQELAVASEALSRLQRESLFNPEKKTQLNALQEEINAKKISAEYAHLLHEKSEIKADRDGVAVFSDATTLRGKPVRTGDKIMSIADPSRYELQIRIPVDSMLSLEKKNDIRFFLNTSPLRQYRANIRSIGYQASIDPDGIMTYKVLADIPDFTGEMRIGWKGSARIETSWTILSYAILRRPLIALRNIFGAW
jgi:hypothetical protein